MVDFFSNLLLRSSAPASRTILQPRLPLLFEPTQSTDQLSIPPADTTMPESFHARAAFAKKDARRPGEPATGSHAAQEKQSSAEQNGQTGLPAHDLATIARSLNTQALQIEPGPMLRMPTRQGAVFSAEPAIETESAVARENGPVSHAEISSVDSQPVLPYPLPLSPFRDTAGTQPGHSGDNPGVSAPAPMGQALKSSTNRTGRAAAESPQPQQSLQPIRDTHPAERPRPILEAVALPAQPISTPLPREPETLVQVHIGRIEVRTMTPPIPPQPMPAPRSQPKMSLDDYLRQREDKR